MRLGLGPIHLDGVTIAELRAFAELAVSESFDCLWIAESRGDATGGGLAAAALVAQLTPIRVGAVVDAGLYHPLYLAEDIAVTDITCGGRLEVVLAQPGPGARQRYGRSIDQADVEEHLSVLVAALGGAHVQWSGTHLRVPARMDANQPVPDRLALNPSPAQPAVPIWLEGGEGMAARVGFGVARMWAAGARVPTAVGRWPGMLMCPADVSAEQLLAAAGEAAGYFLIDAATPAEAQAAGRRLAGPLRMPAFPAWVNA